MGSVRHFDGMIGRMCSSDATCELVVSPSNLARQKNRDDHRDHDDNRTDAESENDYVNQHLLMKYRYVDDGLQLGQVSPFNRLPQQFAVCSLSLANNSDEYARIRVSTVSATNQKTARAGDRSIQWLCRRSGSGAGYMRFLPYWPPFVTDGAASSSLYRRWGTS